MFLTLKSVFICSVVFSKSQSCQGKFDSKTKDKR